MNWSQRVQQLLDQLEERARHCPGLYPVQSSADFKRIVRDYLEGTGSPSSPEDTALWLEELWRNPQLSYQLNAQSLIRRGSSPFSRSSDEPTMEKGVG